MPFMPFISVLHWLQHPYPHCAPFKKQQILICIQQAVVPIRYSMLLWPEQTHTSPNSTFLIEMVEDQDAAVIVIASKDAAVVGIASKDVAVPGSKAFQVVSSRSEQWLPYCSPLQCEL